MLTSELFVSDEVRFIDFEYGGINYQAFDIANHFNEYAGRFSVPLRCLIFRVALIGDSVP